MRRIRRLLLLFIVLIAAGVGITYRNLRTTQARNSPPAPAKLPESLSARASNWSWSETKDGKPTVEVEARAFRQIAEGSRMELEGVELKLYHKDAKAYDQVKSEKADYDVLNGILFSEGDVEITMGVPAEKKSDAGRLVVIKTSGVRFESKTGKAVTDKPASFQFERGEGQSRGAQYDPQTRELQMHQDVKLTWRGQSPTDKPMEIEAGSLTYKEAESKIFLLPWSRFRRDTLAMEGGGSVVTLNKGVLQLVESQAARGVDVTPNRRLEYAADGLRMNFNAAGAIESIVGETNAKLVSSAPTAVTTISANRVDLAFDTKDNDSILKTAFANGGSVIDSKPVARPGVPPADTRILRAESIAMSMRPGGEEIDKVETHSPGEIEFVPNRAGQRHRTMNGERMTIQYGAANEIESFRAYIVSTRTDALPQPKGKAPLPPALTWSKELAAGFDAKVGGLSKLEQWEDFRYEEGDRKAKSQRALLDASTGLITLTGTARAWDASGSTSADSIVMDQRTNDFDATGNVTSTRLPDDKPDTQKNGKQQGLLSGGEPLQAKARRMTSADGRQRIEYTGDAFLWQGANRLQGDRVVIDRKNGQVEAYGNVFSQLLDKQEAVTGTTKRKSSIVTTVKAPELIYGDKERIAHYKGGATLNRANMVVTSREIRAFLKQGGAEGSLEKAFADGAVKVVQTSMGRTRTGTGEHAEHYVDEGKTVLNGGAARLVDSVKGTTEGRQLTYYANTEKLLVEGAQGEPVKSNLLKK